MIVQKKGDVHIHKFVRPKTTTVLLHHDRLGHTTAKDTLKQRVCACGRAETYDLERMEV